MKAFLNFILCFIATAAFAQSDEQPVYGKINIVTTSTATERMENMTLRRPISVYIPLDVTALMAQRSATGLIDLEGTAGIPEEHKLTSHKVPTRSLNMAANSIPLVFSRDGEVPSIRGARPSGTAYYFDGVRVLSAVLRTMR